MSDQLKPAGTQGGSGQGAAVAEAAKPANTEFASALREATEAKNKAAGADAAKTAEDKKPDAGTPGADDTKKGDTADTAGAPEKPAGADTAAGKTAAKSPNNADIKVDWSKVKPALKAAYDAGSPETKEAIEATIVQGLKRGQEVARLRKTVSQGNHRRAPVSTSRRPAKSGEDLKKVLTGSAMTALDKEAPEVTAAVREVVGPLVAELENAGKVQDAQALEALGEEADYQQGVLADIHPDWEAVNGSKEFQTWLAKAAPNVKAMVARNAAVSAEFPQGRIIDGQEAALVLTLFKETAGNDSADGDEPAPGAEKKNGTEGSHQPSPVEKKRELQRQSARVPEIKGAAAGNGIAEDDFQGHLRAATAAKARERSKGMIA